MTHTEALSLLHAGLDGTNTAHLWVDDAKSPRYALLFVGDAFVAGDPATPGACEDIRETAREQLLALTRHLMFWSPSDEWRALLDEALQPIGTQRIIRTAFRLDAALFRESHGARLELPDGFALARHTAETLASLGGMDERWRGVGWCVMHQGERVASAQTVAIGGGHAEVGVNTVEGYRRRGFALASAREVISELLSRGITPDWGCYYNEASGALAAKLGFRGRYETSINYVDTTRAMGQTSGQ